MLGAATAAAAEATAEGSAGVLFFDIAARGGGGKAEMTVEGPSKRASQSHGSFAIIAEADRLEAGPTVGAPVQASPAESRHVRHLPSGCGRGWKPGRRGNTAPPGDGVRL